MTIRNTAATAAFAVTLGLAGAALAQTAPNPANDQRGTPATGATAPTRGSTGGGAGDTTPPAITTQHTEPRTAAAPVAGHNSFTEGQARARMADAGFNDVQSLRLDDQGVWRAQAIQNGQPTGVALDYQGNVVATQR